MDELAVLRFVHLVGLTLMGGGLLGVFVADIRSRQCQDLSLFSQAVAFIAVFYDGLVVPGAILLLGSGTWLIVKFFGGWDFLNTPWLAGMVLLFAFEFVEGNTITRLYFQRLRRLTLTALDEGQWTEELTAARQTHIATFTHFLDIPMLLTIISLAVLRPETWTHFLIATALAITMATTLNYVVPRLYPWERKPSRKPQKKITHLRQDRLKSRLKQYGFKRKKGPKKWL